MRKSKKEYVGNLTRNLINAGDYRYLFKRVGRSEFVSYVKLDLEAGAVAKMNPETLGRIMASFEIGDVMASGRELFANVHFVGDCEDLLRQLVSICLAYAIRESLVVEILKEDN